MVFVSGSMTSTMSASSGRSALSREIDDFRSRAHSSVEATFSSSSGMRIAAARCLLGQRPDVVRALKPGARLELLQAARLRRLPLAPHDLRNVRRRLERERQRLPGGERSVARQPVEHLREFERAKSVSVHVAVSVARAIWRWFGGEDDLVEVTLPVLRFTE